jgi:hypothetical protein
VLIYLDLEDLTIVLGISFAPICDLICFSFPFLVPLHCCLIFLSFIFYFVFFHTLFLLSIFYLVYFITLVLWCKRIGA